MKAYYSTADTAVTLYAASNQASPVKTFYSFSSNLGWRQFSNHHNHFALLHI